MKLYKLSTTGLGDFYTIADDPTSAEKKYYEIIPSTYGAGDSRKIKQITILAESLDDPRFISGKFLIL